MSDRAATAKAKIKCTDSLGNVAYLQNGSGSFRCVLASGMPASLFYAVGNCDEVEFAQRLADAVDDPDRLLRIVKSVAHGRKVEMLSYTAAPKKATTASELMKAVALSVPDDVVYASGDGTTYTGREMAKEIDAESKVAAKFTKELLTSGIQAMQSRAEQSLEQLPAPGMGR
jgi:hypothetical protein